MPTVDQILEVLRAQGPELQRLGVRRLGLFGSAARGEATDASDLDFLVELHRKTFDAYMDVKEALEHLFGRRIDLVVAEAVKPQLRPRILQETIYAEGLSEPFTEATRKLVGERQSRVVAPGDLKS